MASLFFLAIHDNKSFKFFKAGENKLAYDFIFSCQSLFALCLPQVHLTVSTACHGERD